MENIMKSSLIQNSGLQKTKHPWITCYYLIALLTFFCLVMVLYYACSPQVKTSGIPAGGKNDSYISSVQSAEKFPLVAAGQAAPLWIGSGDYPGVLRSLKNLQSDIKSVTDIMPRLSVDSIPAGD